MKRFLVVAFGSRTRPIGCRGPRRYLSAGSGCTRP
jgi:hypothetical protein